MRPSLRQLLSLAAAVGVVFAGVTTSAAGTAGGQQPPVNTKPPTVSGTPAVGSSLAAALGSWRGPGIAYTVAWQRCDGGGSSCAGLGVSGTTYTPTSADATSTLRAVVTATNRYGSTQAVSDVTAPVAGSAAPPPVAPVSTSLPQISGTVQVGGAVTSTTGSWSGGPTSYSFQWQRCSSSGGSCVAISGASASSYTVAAGDAGSTLRVAVSAANAAGTTVAASNATAAVPAAAGSGTSADGRFGVATGGNIQNYSAADLAHYLDLMKAAHATWLRFDLNWNVIQSGGRASYNWAPFDNVVAAATARGLHVLGLILYTPAWARPAGTSSTTPPTNLGDYATFAATAARHFGPLGVHDYEIWNEPNIGFWSPSPDPARYTQMLKQAYAAIKGVDPAATVISAGLSPYGSYGQQDATHMNPLTFLQQMYANGAHGSMDGVGWHPYAYPYGTTYAAWSAWSQMSETTPSARSIMTAAGDGAEQIWPTEFGEPTASTSSSVTESAQAQYVTSAFTKLKGWSWAGPAFLYSGRDAGTDMSSVENAFGIVRNDWSQKPSYTAFAAAAVQ